MPRPKHVVDNEAARASARPVITPGTEDDQVDASKPLTRQTAPKADTLDNAPALAQTSASVSEADDPFVPIAKRAGWVDLKDWDRDPKDHKDARSFVEGLPDALEAGQQRLRRYSQVADAAAEEARQAGIREAERRLREAHRGGDEEAVIRAGQDLAQRAGPHPQTVAWMSRNPWFKQRPDAPAGDDLATAVAVAAIHKAERSGASVEDQLTAGEAAVRERFPEHFGRSPRTESRPTTLAQVTPPPQVHEGSRGTTVRASAEKGWADMPSADRRTYEKDFMRSMLRNGLSRDDAEKRLAKAYWGVGTAGAPS